MSRSNIIRVMNQKSADQTPMMMRVEQLHFLQWFRSFSVYLSHCILCFINIAT